MDLQLRSGKGYISQNLSYMQCNKENGSYVETTFPKKRVEENGNISSKPSKLIVAMHCGIALSCLERIYEVYVSSSLGFWNRSLVLPARETKILLRSPQMFSQAPSVELKKNLSNYFPIHIRFDF